MWNGCCNYSQRSQYLINKPIRLLPRQGPAGRSPGRRKRTFSIVRSAQWLEFGLNPTAYTSSIGRDNLDYGRFRLPTSSDDTQLQHSFVLLGHGSGSSRKPFKIPSASSFVTKFDPFTLISTAKVRPEYDLWLRRTMCRIVG